MQTYGMNERFYRRVYTASQKIKEKTHSIEAPSSSSLLCKTLGIPWPWISLIASEHAQSPFWTRPHRVMGIKGYPQPKLGNIHKPWICLFKYVRKNTLYLPLLWPNVQPLLNLPCLHCSWWRYLAKLCEIYHPEATACGCPQKPQVSQKLVLGYTTSSNQQPSHSSSSFLRRHPDTSACHTGVWFGPLWCRNTWPSSGFPLYILESSAVCEP